jgi:hypothetical protein
MLEKEFKYYLENQNELVKIFNGKYIVIIENQVVDSYDSELEAYVTSKEKYELGTFLIQYVEPGKNNYTQTFHSRVSFA